jgi:hypothetical protein
MAYTREIPMFLKHAEGQGGGLGGAFWGGVEMVYNKMLLEPFVELATNRSYFGKEIWDTNAPGYEQLMQAVKHILSEQTVPMSVGGAGRAIDTGGNAYKEVPLAMLGFGPAPKYAERDAMQNRISHLYDKHVPPGARAYADEANTRRIAGAQRYPMVKKTIRKRSTRRSTRPSSCLKPAYIKGIMKRVGIEMFKQLPVSDQTHHEPASKQQMNAITIRQKETKQKWYEAPAIESRMPLDKSASKNDRP